MPFKYFLGLPFLFCSSENYPELINKQFTRNYFYSFFHPPTLSLLLIRVWYFFNSCSKQVSICILAGGERQQKKARFWLSSLDLVLKISWWEPWCTRLVRWADRSRLSKQTAKCPEKYIFFQTSTAGFERSTRQLHSLHCRKDEVHSKLKPALLTFFYQRTWWKGIVWVWFTCTQYNSFNPQTRQKHHLLSCSTCQWCLLVLQREHLHSSSQYLRNIGNVE